MQPILLLLGFLGSMAIVRPAAAEFYGNCTVQAVATFTNRVHVACTQPYTGTSIYFFATPASDHGMASRMEALGLVAQLTGTPVRLYFDLGDTTGSSFGCAPSDCRRIQGIDLYGQGPLAAATVGALSVITVPESSAESAAWLATASLALVLRRRL